MNYPLISEYIEAIRSAEDNFDKLTNLRPVLDGNGNPIISSGNFAVVFKMEDVETGKLYAVKCFTREQEHRNDNYQKIAEELKSVSSPYLVQFSFFEKELFVDTTQSDEEEFPVLVMDWVDGVPLNVYLRKHISDDYERQMLAYRFCQMGAWLLSQPFAHGDLKPDNILVKQDGTLVLVDYDGMYVPTMQGQKAQELGSPDYRHPLRTEDDFNEHIDDFAIVSIALSLKAISINTSFYLNNSKNDVLLFSMKDYQDITDSESIKSLCTFLYDKELLILYNLFMVAYSTRSITSSIMLIVKEPAPKIYKEGELVVIPEGTDFIGEYEENTMIKCVKIPTTVSRIEESTFRGCISLETIEIPCGVTEIENYAFSGCISLKSIIIQNGVKNIGEEVFKNCVSLKHIIIPSSIVEIGADAFAGCTLLTSIILPYGITKISTGTFSGCTSLEYIKIPDSVREIEDRAFENCSSLKSISLPNNIEFIGYECFCGCTSLTSFVIPNKITEIGECMFSGCTSLESIIIPTTVTAIGYEAFCGCKSLRNISIPENVTEIGAYAFDECVSLPYIKIPVSVKNIGTGVFNHCNKNLQVYSDFLACKESFLMSHNNVLLSYLGNDVNIIIPNFITEIYGALFKDCKFIQSIIIPYGIKKIEDYMFCGCSSLRIVSIPSTVTEIGAYAFSDCISLEMITMPNKLLKIGNCAFENCTSLQNVEIPNYVEDIGSSAFSGCSSLNNIILPCDGRLFNLANSIFKNCSSLRSIIIPNNVKKIGFEAFAFCVSLQTIKIGNSVKEIGKWSFRDCFSLDFLYIPDSTNKIYDMAFYGCLNLKFMRLPDNVVVECSAFTNCNKKLHLDCSSLEITNGLVLANNRTSIISCLDNVFDVVIPNGVIKIKSFAFLGCTKIQSIYIPMGCKEIEFGAFKGCTNLEKIFIPSSIKNFDTGWVTGFGPFDGCISLKKIYVSSGYKQKLMKFKGFEYFNNIIKELQINYEQ